MNVSVAILDTGSGNLRSVEKALAHVGGRPCITGDPDTIARADRVVVPGQGAFGEFEKRVRERGLDAALRQVIRAGKPFLGICLGMQMLFDESEEQGPVAGFGLLAGRVVRFRPRDPAHKVPHMGWNRVQRGAAGHSDPVLAGIPDGAYFYFVHSYYAIPTQPDAAALTSEYADLEFTAAVRKDNIFACQFHPEKSQRLGLRLLANFLESL